MFIRYRLNHGTSSVYSRRRERRRHPPGRSRRADAVDARPLSDLRRRQRRRDDVPGRREPGGVVQRCAATLALVAVGSVAGAALVAALAPLGPRLRVPSVIAARPALGIAGAGLVAVVLYVTQLRVDRAEQRDRGVGVRARRRGVDRTGRRLADRWAIVLGLARHRVVWLRPARGGARRSRRRAGDAARRRRADDRLRRAPAAPAAAPAEPA